jgi:hypothetical protein
MVAMSDAFLQSGLTWLVPTGVETRTGASNVGPLPASPAMSFIAVLLVARTGYYRTLGLCCFVIGCTVLTGNVPPVSHRAQNEKALLPIE